MSEHLQQTTHNDGGTVGMAQPPTEFLHLARAEARTLPVVATYHLSEEGRKASLLAGGDGRAVQELKVQVPTNRFHLVNVDADGQARLKLQPRYDLNDNQEVTRKDGPPIFDRVPTFDDLLKEAARNHQLERAYQADRAERQRKRNEAGFEAHQKLAEEFLADPARRSLEHPKPSRRKCYLTTKSGRQVLFDAKRDIGLARQVPPEAYRRFCQDYSVRREKNFERRSEQLTLHNERDRFVADWLAQHGTTDQRERHGRGMLPLKEVLDCIADVAFVAAQNKTLYSRDGVTQLQEHLRKTPQFEAVVVTKDDLIVDGEHAASASEAQWAFLQELQSLLPEANVTLRLQRLSYKPDSRAPALRHFFALATQRVGPFTIRREYLGPDA